MTARHTHACILLGIATGTPGPWEYINEDTYMYAWTINGVPFAYRDQLVFTNDGQDAVAVRETPAWGTTSRTYRGTVEFVLDSLRTLGPPPGHPDTRTTPTGSDPQ